MLDSTPWAVIVSSSKHTDNKIYGANMGPTWVLSAPDGPHVGHINLAIRAIQSCSLLMHWSNEFLDCGYEIPFNLTHECSGEACIVGHDLGIHDWWPWPSWSPPCQHLRCEGCQPGKTSADGCPGETEGCRGLPSTTTVNPMKNAHDLVGLVLLCSTSSQQQNIYVAIIYLRCT